MLDHIKRWLSSRVATRHWPAVAAWATEQACSFKAKPEGDGFIIEKAAPVDGWRIEWGTSQRPYIEGFELRLRAPLADSDTLHLLVMSRRLLHKLDADIFQQYTEDLQTRIDGATPDEMRWLVLYPKLSSTALGELRESFGACGHPTEAVAMWLGGPFGAALRRAATTLLAPDEPFVVMLQRGRMTLRVPMPQPDVDRIEALLGLFRTACREARSVLEQHGGGRGLPPSTQPSLWERGGETMPPR